MHADLDALDPSTTHLIRLAALIAAGTESELREALLRDHHEMPAAWIDELIIQSYLFAGFPRALNAAREWRRLSPAPAAETLDDVEKDARMAGERTCAAVYGRQYDKLRVNIAGLHPALDEAMLVEGYGKILSRPALDLPRRELCIVAACAVTGQDRQLHSHLHGALNVGVSPDVLRAAIDALHTVLPPKALEHVRLLLARVLGK